MDNTFRPSATFPHAGGRDHRKYHFGVGRKLGRRGVALGAGVDERRSRLRTARIDAHRMAVLHQIERHRPSHHAQAYESELHCVPPFILNV